MATITDFLKQQGKPSDYKSRQALAAQYGIQGYVGSAPQNISLLQKLQQAGTPVTPVAPPAGVAAAPVVPGSPTVGNVPPSGQPVNTQLANPLFPSSPQTSPQGVAPDPTREYRLNLARNALRNVYGREATQQEIDALAYDPTLSSQGQLESRLRFQQNPVAAVEQLYQQQHTNLGLPGIKESIQQATTKLGELDQKKLDEIANINNNPWISEGERNRRIIQLDQKYEQKRGALANQLQLQQGLYDRGSQFAQNVVQQALYAQESDLTSSHQAIQQAMARAAKQAELQHQIANDTIDQQRQLALASAGTEPINVAGYQILPKGAVDPTELLKARIAAQGIAARTAPNVTFQIPGLLGSFTGGHPLPRAPQGIGNISPGIMDAINNGQLAPSEITRGNLPILNQLFDKFPNLDVNDANARQKALKQLQTQETMTRSFESTARSNLDLASKLGDKVDRTGSTLLNKYFLYAKGQIGSSPDVLSFDAAVKTATNEYAKVITGQTTGQAVSDAARRETENLLSAAYSPAAFKAVVATMKTEMDNRLQGFSESRSTLRNAGRNTTTIGSGGSSGGSNDPMGLR